MADTVKPISEQQIFLCSDCHLFCGADLLTLRATSAHGPAHAWSRDRASDDSIHSIQANKHHESVTGKSTLLLASYVESL